MPESSPLAATPIIVSTITCPQCGRAQAETMPINACQVCYDCKAFGAVLGPKAGDCCVF